MKVLVVGLGSMGKRRIRNLMENNITDISGFDIRKDRIEETVSRFKIKVVEPSNFNSSLNEFNAMIISTPPDVHMKYANWALDKGIPCFIEASVTDSEGIAELIELNKKSKSPIFFAPSCTMKYFPMPKLVKELIQSKEIGKEIYFNYVIGQYLRDWHPWEDIKDFYVSKRETGGAREILPFELTWLNDIWGNPLVISGYCDKLTDLDTDIYDFYTTVLKYPNGVIGNIIVEVISQPIATRELRIAGSKGIITYSSESNKVQVFLKSKSGLDKKDYLLEKGTIEEHYINPEEPYVNEIKDFLKACKSGKIDDFPNNLSKDLNVLKKLNEVEESSNRIKG